MIRSDEVVSDNLSAAEFRSRPIDDQRPSQLHRSQHHIISNSLRILTLRLVYLGMTSFALSFLNILEHRHLYRS
jgi:hypothetical protein